MTKFIDNTRKTNESNKKTEFTHKVFAPNDIMCGQFQPPSDFDTVTYIGKATYQDTIYDKFLAEDKTSDPRVYYGIRGYEFKIGKVGKTEYIDNITDEVELVKTSFNKVRYAESGDVQPTDTSPKHSKIKIVMYLGKDKQLGDTFMVFYQNNRYRIYYETRGYEFDEPSVETPEPEAGKEEVKEKSVHPIENYLAGFFQFQIENEESAQDENIPPVTNITQWLIDNGISYSQ